MSQILRIGNAQAFWGDSPDAAVRLATQQPDLDYLTLDYLSEVSMSIMAIQQEKDPEAGYARDFLDVVASLVPLWKNQSPLKVISNAGGLNPWGCARAVVKILQQSGCFFLKVGVVFGDDVLPIILKSPQNPLFRNLETDESPATRLPKFVTANAYLGAKPISQALQAGAHIVITGRVADPSLTVAPCAAHFGWRWDDYQRLAGATVAGHLIECGTQVTGGFSTKWMDLPDMANCGFPIAEVDSSGNCIITKPAGTGGCVDCDIVKEQLLYEIGDPANYLSPDVSVSFCALQVEQLAPNRVSVSGAIGQAPPASYKVSATYRDGYRTEATLSIFGKNARSKAQKCGEVLLQKVRNAGYTLQKSKIECLGSGDVVPGMGFESESLECVLRVSAADPRKEPLERLAKEIAPLVTSGPQGVTGYTSGRPKIRPVFGYWPCLISTEEITPAFAILEVSP